MFQLKMIKKLQFWAFISASGFLITVFFNAGNGIDIVLLKAENPRYEGNQIKDQTFSLRLRQNNVRTVEVFSGVGETNKCQTISYTFPVPSTSTLRVGSSSNRPTVVISGAAVTQTQTNSSGATPVSVPASEIPSIVITIPFNSNHTLWMRTKDVNNNYGNCESIFIMSPYLYRAQDQGTAAGLYLATADNSILKPAGLTLSEGFRSNFPERTVFVRPRYYGRDLGDEAKITLFLGESCNQKLGETSYTQAMVDGVTLEIPNTEDERPFTLSAKLQYKSPGVYPQIHHSRCYIFARNLESRVLPPEGRVTLDNLAIVSFRIPDLGNKFSKIELRNSCEQRAMIRELTYSNLRTIEPGYKDGSFGKWQAQKPGIFYYRAIGLNGRYGLCGKLVEYSRGTTPEERARDRVQIVPQFDKSKFKGLKVKFPAIVEGRLQIDPMYIWVKEKESDRFSNNPIIIPITEGHEWTHLNAASGIHYEYKLSRGGRDIQFLSSGGYLVPWQEKKGTILIIVEDLLFKFAQNNIKGDLSSYISTLNSEGWQVEVITGKRHLDTDFTQATLDLWSNKITADTFWRNRNEILKKNNLAVAELKNKIIQVYNKNPGQLKAVLLVGHLPIPFSGTRNIDGHDDHKGAWPADSYYASLSAAWDDGQPTEIVDNSIVRFENQNSMGDGKFNDDFVPGNTAFQIGRIDFSLLDIGLENKTKATNTCSDSTVLARYSSQSVCEFSWQSWTSFHENTLLNTQNDGAQGFINSFNKYLNQYRRYFKKNIAYRNGDFYPQNSLIQSTSAIWGAGSFSNAAPSLMLFPKQNIKEIFPPQESFQVPIELSKSAALFVHTRGYSHYVKNGGAIHSDQALASAPQSMRAVFWGMIGSYFGDTYSGNNLLRAVLSSPTLDPVKDGNWGLASYYTHYPIMHRMALGGTIGESIKLALDQDSFENTSIISHNRGHVSSTLQGDPTLRMHVVPTPVSVSWSKNSKNKTAEIRWKARANSSVSYYEIYWGKTISGTKIQIGKYYPNIYVYNPYQLFKWVDDKYSNQSSGSFYWVRPVYIQESLAGSYINKGLYTPALRTGFTEK